jgi:serine/threonine-protein kinase RsbW
MMFGQGVSEATETSQSGEAQRKGMGMTVPRDESSGLGSADRASGTGRGPTAGADLEAATNSAGPSTADEISLEIRLPVDPARLPLLRSIAATLAGAQDFDIDTIADLRMAVDEMGATLIRRARPGTQLDCTFVADADGMTVSASCPSVDGRPVDETSFGWMVLTTLTTGVRATVTDADGGVPVVAIELRVSPERVSP